MGYELESDDMFEESDDLVEDKLEEN